MRSLQQYIKAMGMIHIDAWEPVGENGAKVTPVAPTRHHIVFFVKEHPGKT